MRILLTEDRDKHVAAGYFTATTGLHVIDGALQHALEAECRLRVAAITGRQYRHRLGDARAQIGMDLLEVSTAGAQA